jgi:hypothetical protein
MDWNSTNLAIALSATILTIVGIWAGYMLIVQQRDQYRATLNPTPTAINTVLPTQASIDMGESLFNTQCAWITDANLFNRFVTRLPVVRDDELFDIVEVGWRDQPACDVDLSSEERWHIVNYWRTLEPKDS